jgi:hypothetical protein
MGPASAREWLRYRRLSIHFWRASVAFCHNSCHTPPWQRSGAPAPSSMPPVSTAHSLCAAHSESVPLRKSRGAFLSVERRAFLSGEWGWIFAHPPGGCAAKKRDMSAPICAWMSRLVCARKSHDTRSTSLLPAIWVFRWPLRRKAKPHLSYITLIVIST